MKGRLWLLIFAQQLLMLFVPLLALLAFFIWGLDLLNFQQFWDLKAFDLPLTALLLAAIILIAAFYASIYSLQINQPYEDIQARLNWLVMGKYNHTIFSETNQKKGASNQMISLYQDIEDLRQKLIQLSSDIQEYSAAPTFVGQDTKEEIIEGERGRIARELHDSVSQDLFAATMMLSALNEGMDDLAPEKLKQAVARIDQVIARGQTEMRALLLHLRPVELRDRRLTEGLEQILKELQGRVPITINWQLDPSIRLDSGIEDHLFRIAQESISNTLRHAQASQLDVYLEASPDSVDLRVIDDGIGFDLEKLRNAGNYGLANIEERVKSLGGQLRIRTLPKQGTAIIISIPKTRPMQIERGTV